MTAITRPIAGLFGMLAALTLAAWPARATPRKVPPGSWAIEYQADTCTASRDGVGGAPGIAIRTRPLTEPHELMVYGQFARPRQRQFEGTLAIGAEGPPVRRWMLAERARNGAHSMLETTVTAAELAQLGTADRLRLAGSDGFALAVPLSNMTAALAALRKCEVYLLGRWGITAADVAGWVTPARPLDDLHNLFWDKDMRKVVVIRGKALRGVLTITPDGSVSDCRIVERSVVRWANDRFCPTLRQRARFEPARDAAGNPVTGIVVTPPITSARLR